MICKKCHVQHDDSCVVCPDCGGALASPHPPKKRVRWVVSCVLAFLLVAMVGAIIWQSTKHRTPTPEDMAQSVMTSGTFALSNTELNYYFWSEYFFLVNNYSDYLPQTLDPSLPLDEQQYDTATTWQDYILEQTLQTVQSTMSMVFEAEKAAFSLTEAYKQSLNNVLVNFETYALNSGFINADGTADMQAYLAASYGPGATVDTFTTYLHNSFLAAAYSDELYDRPSFTEQEISDYYELYAGEYAENGVAKVDTQLCNIRTVLLQPSGAEATAWEETEATAQTLYETWQAESGSETDFATMVTTHTADPEAAAVGGLVTGVQPSDLDDALAHWVFAADRQQGDSGVVRTEDGWVIVYFVGSSGQTVWQKAAEADLRQQTYGDAFRKIMGTHVFEVDRDAIVIATPTGLYDGAAVVQTVPAGN